MSFFNFFKKSKSANSKRQGEGLVLITSADRAKEFWSNRGASLIVSISDPELRPKTRALLKGTKADVKELDFHDIERPSPDLIFFSKEHFEHAIASARALPQKANIIVHCHAGISRSGAVGLLIAVDRNMQSGLDTETAIDEALNMLKQESPYIRPNMGIMDMGIDILGLGSSSLKEKAWRLHAG